MKKRIKGKLLNVKVLEEKGDYCICEFPTKENRIVFNYELTDTFSTKLKLLDRRIEKRVNNFFETFSFREFDEKLETRVNELIHRILSRKITAYFIIKLLLSFAIAYFIVEFYIGIIK